MVGDTRPESLMGTWVWCNHRHDMTVTYRVDGTYARESQFANQTEPQNANGTWRIEGNNLIETDAEKDSEPMSSVIKFINNDKFELNGFMLFERIPEAGTPGVMLIP